MSLNHELIIPNDDLPFRLFVFEGKDGNYIRERHWHRSIEIFAVLQGELTFYIDEKKYPLTCGEFMLVNSNEVHAIHAPNENWTIVLQIPLHLLEAYCTEDQYILFTHNPIEKDQKLMELIHKIYTTYSEKERGYDLKVRGLFYLLLHLLISEYQNTDVSDEDIRRNKNLNHLSSITNYIKENYDSDLSLEQIAKIFGYSPTYLSRMFRTYAGISYKTYLQDIRLRYAWKDIQNKESSLNDIALKHGFANSKALARAFEKKFHMLPSEYLRRNQ